MSGQAKGMKRARTQDQQDGAASEMKQPGRDQLLLSSPDLQTRLGRKFVDETELLPLLLAYSLVRRVRTIQIHVRPLGGDSFKVALEASKPIVGEAKAEIARTQGTAAGCQELYRVAERADGSAVREDDAEPEPLEDESLVLKDGDVIAMAVKVRSVTEFTDSSLATVHDCQLPVVHLPLLTSATPPARFFCVYFGTQHSIVY
jgi:hypothetical protein